MQTTTHAELKNSSAQRSVFSLLICSGFALVCEGEPRTYFPGDYRMTIVKMYLLLNMDFGGRGDSSSKPGPRVNVCGLFGVLMMMGLFLLGSLHAQTGQSALTGTVSDSSGAIVSGAGVSVLNTATGVVRTTVTDGSGLFSIQALNPGEYRVTVSGKGFQSSTTTGIVLSAGQTSSLSPVLQIGKETVTVTVTTDSALLNKDSSDVITTVNHTIVENLPYPEQSSLEATLLVPGVNGDPLQPGGITTENPGASTAYVTPGASITIGGGGPGVNAILVDGSDGIQGSYARAGVNLSGLVVGETSVITAGMSAKYGRNGGGVIIQASRPAPTNITEPSAGVTPTLASTPTLLAPLPAPRCTRTSTASM